MIKSRCGGYCLLLAVVVCLTSCAARKGRLEKMQMDCTERITKGLENYKKKKYASALTRLEDARMQCSGTPVMDTVLFYLGMANIKTKKYTEARTEFQRLVQEYPGSPFFDEAKFRIGYSVYRQSNKFDRDQKETREAIRIFDGVIESYPESRFIDSVIHYRSEAYEKLATKEFENAEFYVKISEPEAAAVYFRAFLDQFSDSKLADRARLMELSLLVKLDRMAEASERYEELMEKSRSEETKKEAKLLLGTVNKSAAKEKPRQ